MCAVEVCPAVTDEVKSTGEKFRVVIFPSTVMANVAMTKGRREFDLRADLFRFADLMLEGRDFVLHFAQLHVFGCATRLVKEINDATRGAADQDDEKT